jgi:Dolichyl-phosphate-mannose-protein mannosyltransferase
MTTAERRVAWALLALVLAGAFVLRVWGIKQGLPYSYNSDEDAHFVPRAIGMFVLGYNPHYFANPPAYTYLLHLVFAVWFGGRAGVSHAFAANPTAVFVVSRAVAALLGTLAVWLLYLAGARLFDRATALLAAALEAVAFLPVFYAHLALNDVPTLAPLTLSLLGTAGVLRKGRLRDYLLAGVGLGLGCATKYTAGVVLLPLLAAAAAQYLTPTGQSAAAQDLKPAPIGDRPEGLPAAGGPAGGQVVAAERPAGWQAERRVLAGLALAGAAALVAFVAADPYSVLAPHSFYEGIAHQSAVSDEAQGKLGAPRTGGIAYYLWSLTWGLGWVPSLAALGGAVAIWWRERRLGWLLVPAPLAYLAFMGAQGRYFGRWLLPIFPILCLLAAFFALSLARALARWSGRALASRRAPAERTSSAQPTLTAVFVALAVLALCAQGIVYTVHSDLVLSRADTRNLTRAWMVAHVPPGSQVVVEPVVPDEWVRDVGHPTPGTPDGGRWVKYDSLVSLIDSAGALHPSEPHVLTIEDYERTLGPALIGWYEHNGYCWVVSGFTQSGRAVADPAQVPHAVAYYRALARQGQVVYHISPYAPGAAPVAFNFDWTFDYYPLAYQRPGPEMTVYRLHGGRCSARV